MTATIPKGFHPEPFSYHQELELDIDALSNAGDGIGRVDGWVVFVPFALPGDRVKARVWRNDKNYSSADLVEVLHPSPDRVEPGCRLFGTCGGCQYQHFSYDLQLLWKTRQVADLLRLQAGLELPVNPAIASPANTTTVPRLRPILTSPGKAAGRPSAS
ncbi:TRAM domain-containing protein [Akkermansia massiliensis]